MLKKLFRKLKKKSPQPVSRHDELQAQFPDFDEDSIKTIESVEPYTMTSPERVYSVCQSARYLVENEIDGDIVECGVWRGGSMMAIARTLLQAADRDRTLHLYDTFSGMPPATDVDRDFLDQAAADQLDSQDKQDPKSVWCYSGLDEVKANLSKTSYPATNLRFVQGKVEDTLLDDLPEKISMLRLDTDWYESTKVCLEQLYPRLVPGGILIIDDYGHWQGCQKAVDEYFQKIGVPVFLQRIDYTGRITVKPIQNSNGSQTSHSGLKATA